MWITIDDGYRRASVVLFTTSKTALFGNYVDGSNKRPSFVSGIFSDLGDNLKNYPLYRIGLALIMGFFNHCRWPAFVVSDAVMLNR
jgi:hypothetical protein